MSALSQLKVPFVYSPGHLPEIELMRLIGTIAWNSSREDDGFDAIAAAIVRFPGFVGFRFEPLEILPHLPGYETARPRRKTLDSFARAEVAANGRVWGEIRLFFTPDASPAVESPLRLARFIGQQVGLMLNRLAFQRQHRELLTRLERIGNIIRRRRAILSAADILATRRDISPAEALKFMAGYAKRNGRRLLDISESLILGCNQSMITRPLLRNVFRPVNVLRPVYAQKAPGTVPNASARREPQDALSV